MGQPERDSALADALPVGEVQPSISQPELLSGKRVLIVEDDANWQYLISAFFRQAGAEVCVVSRAEEAISRLDSELFDLLCTDLHLGSDVDNEGRADSALQHGDAVIRHVLARQLPVHVVFASGTLADVAKKRLAETLPMVTFLEKDALAAPVEAAGRVRAQLAEVLERPPVNYASECLSVFVAGLMEAREALLRIDLDSQMISEVKGDVFALLRNPAFKEPLRRTGDLEAIQDGLKSLYPKSAGESAGGNLHDFKNLLGGMVQRERATGEKQYGSDLMRALARLSVMINQFLNQAQRRASKADRIPAKDVVAGVVANFNGLLGKERVRHVIPEAAELPLPSALLTRVLANLIDNALHADPGNDEITVCLGQYGLDVTNTGVFPEEWVGPDKMLLADRVTTTHAIGSGTGLKEIDRIAREHGMRVTVHIGNDYVKIGLRPDRSTPPEVAERDVALVFEPPEAMHRRKILVIDHDVAGDFEWMNDPDLNRNFEVEVASGEHYPTRFFEEHPDDLNDVFMVVLHHDGFEHNEILKLLAERHPHVVVKWAYGAGCSHGRFRSAENLALKIVERDRETAFVLDGSYADLLKQYTPERWQEILRRATEMHMNLVERLGLDQDTADVPAGDFLRPPEGMKGHKILIFDHAGMDDFGGMVKGVRERDLNPHFPIQVIVETDPLTYLQEHPQEMEGVFMVIVHQGSYFNSMPFIHYMIQDHPAVVLKTARGGGFRDAIPRLREAQREFEGVLIGNERPRFIMTNPEDYDKTYDKEGWERVLQRAAEKHLRLVEWLKQGLD